MIPDFPKFKKLSLEDKEEVNKCTSQFLPYSDFNFTSLWSWNVQNSTQIALFNNNLVIKFSDYITGSSFYSLIGNKDVYLAFSELFSFLKANGMKEELRLVPEISIERFNENSFECIEDRDNFDYVYSVPMLAAYKGGSYERVRNLKNRFLREYKDARVCVIDLSTEEGRGFVVQVNEKWQENKIDFSTTEEKAIERLVSHAEYFSLLSVGVSINNNPVAFSISELLPANYAISHFVKADISCKGIYSYLMNAVAQVLLQEECRFLNYEQDLGLPELKRAKSAFYPEYFLKKYIVKPR